MARYVPPVFEPPARVWVYGGTVYVVSETGWQYDALVANGFRFANEYDLLNDPVVLYQDATDAHDKRDLRKEQRIVALARSIVGSED